MTPAKRPFDGWPQRGWPQADGVRVGFDVAVEIELRGSEPDCCVVAARELVVGQAVDEGGRGTLRWGVLATSSHGVRQGWHRERRRDQGRIFESLRGAHRALRPLVHRLVLER